jgi:hypothetical protein
VILRGPAFARLRLAARPLRGLAPICVAARLLAALWLALPVAAAPSGDAAPLCLARAQVVPPEGFPGQQLVWRLEILRRPETTRVDWVEPPGFPGFRAEWLPGQPDLAGVTVAGAEYVARVEERALFPERAGELLIAGALLRCAPLSGPPVETQAEPIRVRVWELPEQGRPPDFSGLVGLFSVELVAKPGRVELGSSTRLEVSLRGASNLWDARDPLAGASGPEGIELFPARPRLQLEPGVQLAVRRSFEYDAVPLREGRLLIPSLRVPYFDPDQRRYRIASSRELAIEVAPRAAERSAAQPAKPGAQATAAPRRRWLWALAALAAVSVLAGALARRRRAEGSGAQLAELEAEAGADDEAARQARALRRSLQPHLAGARSSPVEELCAPPGADPAVERALTLLAEVERSRFDPRATAVPRAAVRAAIQALGSRSGGSR